MASINDIGGASPDTLADPPLGGPGGWAAAVAAALDGRDETVDTRITAATASMATDAEVAAAVTAHEAKADPHPGYLTPAEHAAIDHTGLPGVGSGGGASKLDDLTDVDAPAATPAGKVLGTTAQGVWGPVDPPSGGGGGTTFEFWAYVDRNSTKLSKFIANGPGLQASPPFIAFAQRLNGASVDFTLPTIETGDLLVVAGRLASGAGAAPAGFRQLVSRSCSEYCYVTAVKAATPAESGTTLTVNVGGTQTHAILLVIRGSTGNANDVEFGGEDSSTASRNSIDPPVFVPAYGKAAWLWLNVAVTYGSDATGVGLSGNPGILATTGAPGLFVAYLSSDSADRIDPSSWSFSKAYYAGTHTIGIRGV